jgi:short-subunit dehydrogenase
VAQKFLGKTVFITGASAGIGAGLAVEFGREGANVVVAARRREQLATTVARVQETGSQALAAICDVTVPDTLRQAVAEAVQKFGGIDIAIANAGFGVSGLFCELTVDDFRRQFETNFFGVLNTIYAVLPHLKNSHGRIVLMGSVLGRVGLPVCSAYSASKFALNGLAENLYYDLSEEGVKVSWINPGLVQSDFARVDNQGVYHAGREDPRPLWLTMPTAKAAAQMVRAIYRGKTEIVITGHGKLILFLSRHFPNLWRFVLHLRSKGKLKHFKEKRRSQD